MAKHTQTAVKPILADDRPISIMRIDGMDVRYAEYEYRSEKLQLREIDVEQAQEVTQLYTEIGFMEASGLTGAGSVNLDDMYAKICQPAYIRRWLAAVLVRADGRRIDVEFFSGHLFRELTSLYREAFMDFFGLNPSLFESFGLSLALGAQADQIGKIMRSVKSST